MVQARNSGSSHTPFQPWKAQSTLAPWWRASFARRPVSRYTSPMAAMLRDGDVLHEHVRRLQHQRADAAGGPAPGVDDRDGGAVAVAHQDRVAHPGRLQHPGEHPQSLVMHEAHGPGSGTGSDRPYPARL